jgi:2-desacetyl-2-hydroxyethyl bacteriochlorophyllide A dehydrogenase
MPLKAEQEQQLKNLRSAILGVRDVTFQEIDLPTLSADQVRVRTHYSLISPGTEVAMFNGSHIGFADPENRYAKFPFLPGYSAIGEVIEMGNEVSHLKAGDHIYYYGKHERIGTAETRTSVVLIPPAGIDPKHVPFVRLAQVSYTALAASEGVPAGLVAVVGLGMIGNFAAQLYQRAGATVFAFDTLQARCDWAKACGIANVVKVDGDLVEAILGATGGSKAALVVEATGVGALAAKCLEAVGFRGKVVLLGSPREPVTINSYKLLHRPCASLIGAHVNLVPVVSDSALDQRAVTRELLEAIAVGELIVAPLLSSVVRPMDLANSYNALENRKDEVIGILLDWRQ